MPYSVKSVLWLLIDIFSLICLYYVIYTITGVPKFDLDTRIGRASVVLISLIFWLILIIKFSIRKDIREAIRQQQIFALSSLISILSVFIQNIFQELIAKFLFPEWYDLIPCTAEELEVSGIIFSRYIILSIFLLITTAALSFSISYLCISRKGKKKQRNMLIQRSMRKLNYHIRMKAKYFTAIIHENLERATKVKLFFFNKNFCRRITTTVYN